MKIILAYLCLGKTTITNSNKDRLNLYNDK